MRKTRVGILTFSDGREHIHQSLVNLNRRYRDELAAALQATGQVEVVPGGIGKGAITDFVRTLLTGTGSSLEN